MIKSIVTAVLRWAALFVGATIGSMIGRVLAARLYGEPLDSPPRLDARTLLEQDVAPGLVAVELLGRVLRLGVRGEALLAAVGAAASAIATGPWVGASAVRPGTLNRSKGETR